MAVFEIRSEEKEGEPSVVERIEVRPWRLGGGSYQDFVIGSGANFDASSCVLLEIIYSVNGAQLFYTRNVYHCLLDTFTFEENHVPLERFISGEQDGYGFGGMLPETTITLHRKKHTSTDAIGEQTYTTYELEISADIGAGVCHASPGERWINIKLVEVNPEPAIDFMRQLTREITDVFEGRHPDPASLPGDLSAWGFARQVNQRAYDIIALDYQEKYFSEPLVTESFDAWLGELPAGGHVLDLGCGHGIPVITRMLQKGFHVTGADLSPKMLERARENFPDVPFLNLLASEMRLEAEFDGACSFSSLLYQDPIDLSHSLYRLHRALRPGGSLYLYAYDLHPSWRGQPYHIDIEQWMWGWTYGMDEAVRCLEEHGYFKVLRAQEVTSEAEKQERIEKWYVHAKEEYEENIKNFPTVPTIFQEPDRNKPPRLAYKYMIVAQVQSK